MGSEDAEDDERPIHRVHVEDFFMAVQPVTHADYAVRDDPEISFNAGGHRFSARVDRARWERACNVVYADLAVDVDAGPAWARS